MFPMFQWPTTNLPTGSWEAPRALRALRAWALALHLAEKMDKDLGELWYITKMEELEAGSRC